jgi:type II secretory pathway pseudopilin PulG
MRYSNIYNSNRTKAEEVIGQGSGFRNEGSRFRVQGSENKSSFILHPSSFRTPSSFILHPSSFPRAVTLIEMLIVVSIVMILMVVTLKAIQPTGDRRLRETARVVSVYLSSAQNRAMELGRPCGVIFRRAKDTNTKTVSMTLDQCEVPPPYAGDMMNAVVRVQDQSTYDSSGALTQVKLRIQIRTNDFSDKLIRPGDLMQLNNQGNYFTIQPPDATNPYTDFLPDTDGYFKFSDGSATTDPDWIDSNYLTLSIDLLQIPINRLPPWSSPVSFQILRQPDKVRSSASSLQLPKGAVVDLNLSCMESGASEQYFTGINDDLYIIFAANGAVEGYYLNGKQQVLGPIFLLIGQTKLIDPVTGTDDNGADMSNFWVTINPQTGLISTNEMASGADPKKYARESQSMGGR